MVCFQGCSSVYSSHLNMADKKDDHKNNNNKIKKGENGILPQKEFKPRNSFLTDLYAIDHFKSIKHCFVAAMINMLLNTFIVDALDSGGYPPPYHYVKVGFAQFDKTVVIWIVMFLCTLSVYPVFCVWAKMRVKLKPKSFLVKLWDFLWLSIFLSYFAAFLAIPPYIKGVDFPMGSSAIVLCEQIRMLMKTHAFVRSNVPRVTSFKLHAEKSNPIPDFGKYLYFLFVPTIVYRDEYPRTKEIRWSYVALNFLEVFVSICFLAFVIANYIVPDFKDFGLKPTNWKAIFSSMFRMMLPSSTFFLGGWYLLLHSWHNAWAEMLRFADRLFYRDWWNTSTFTAYYRKWNIVIYDYLHAYIYRDLYEIVLPGNNVFAACVVFLISALVHEYIIGFMVGFFFPVMFIQFIGFGMTLTFIKLKDKHFVGNTFLWWSISFGVGIQHSLYAMEYYARINCPTNNKGLSDYFIPRMLSCKF